MWHLRRLGRWCAASGIHYGSSYRPDIMSEEPRGHKGAQCKDGMGSVVLGSLGVGGMERKRGRR